MNHILASNLILGISGVVPVFRQSDAHLLEGVERFDDKVWCELALALRVLASSANRLEFARLSRRVVWFDAKP